MGGQVPVPARRRKAEERAENDAPRRARRKRRAEEIAPRRAPKGEAMLKALLEPDQKTLPITP
jgi:hypothetical protein